jgi:hypothetical protein
METPFLPEYVLDQLEILQKQRERLDTYFKYTRKVMGDYEIPQLLTEVAKIRKSFTVRHKLLGESKLQQTRNLDGYQFVVDDGTFFRDYRTSSQDLSVYARADSSIRRTQPSRFSMDLEPSITSYSAAYRPTEFNNIDAELSTVKLYVTGTSHRSIQNDVGRFLYETAVLMRLAPLQGQCVPIVHEYGHMRDHSNRLRHSRYNGTYLKHQYLGHKVPRRNSFDDFENAVDCLKQIHSMGIVVGRIDNSNMRVFMDNICFYNFRYVASATMQDDWKMLGRYFGKSQKDIENVLLTFDYDGSLADIVRSRVMVRL